MTRKQIIWQHWRSPYGSDEDEFVPEDKADVPSPWEERENGQPGFDVRPVVITPMGLIPIHPYRKFTEYFQFWVGDTNFDVTPSVRDTIEGVEGVEILDVLTRYSFRIAVGKVFDGARVKYDIQAALNALPPKKGEINPYAMTLDQETRDKVSILQSTLKDKFPYWAVFVLPNGEIDVAGANTQEGYDMHLDLYEKAQEVAGGVIYQYS